MTDRTTELRTRLMHEDDREEVLLCMSDLQEAERAIDERLLPAEAVVVRLLEQLIEDVAHYGGGIIVAENRTGVVGYLGLLLRVPNDDGSEMDYNFAQISDLAVRRGHRSQGIGSALIDAARKMAVEAGARWLRINALAHNEGARRLYRRAGFDEREVVMEQNLTGGNGATTGV